MTIYLDQKRFDYLDLPTKLQHVIAGVSLFVIVMHKLNEGDELAITLIELAIASAVIVTFLWEMRALKRKITHGAHHHPPVGWFDLAAGGLLLWEAFHGEHHKAPYLRAPFLAGITTIALGLFHARMHSFRRRRNFLAMEETRVRYRGGPFRRFNVATTDLESVDLTEESATFHETGGRRHTISLRQIRNGAEVRKAIAEHFRPAGLLRG